MEYTEAPLDLLVVAPHPDDAEISTGGLIVKCRRQGWRVGVVDLTTGEPTPFGSEEVRRRETAEATTILDLSWRHNLGLKNRQLEASIDARRQLAAVFRLTRPRVIFAPYWEDSHPDHVSASQLVDAARFWSKLSRTDMPGEPYHPPKIFYYWSIHLRIHPQPAFVVDISESIEEKMASVRAYASQFLTNREQVFPTPLDDIRDRARYWGWSIYRPYGEAYASRESLRIDDLNHLLPPPP